MGHTPEVDQDSSVLSTSTILILSGFLLGISVAQPLGEAAFYVFISGMTGMVAYLALEVTGLRKERVLLQQDQKQMEARLLRHIGTPPAAASPEEQERRRLLEWLKQETEALME